ncbi:hypothetical protein C8J57DRAFT_1532987 [Mycena rebaudengoi]|nr:hypothetical protein C8J57DRAFT_1532987 [Mycena rebaudengoi]
MQLEALISAQPSTIVRLTSSALRDDDTSLAHHCNLDRSAPDSNLTDSPPRPLRCRPSPTAGTTVCHSGTANLLHLPSAGEGVVIAILPCVSPPSTSSMSFSRMRLHHLSASASASASASSLPALAKRRGVPPPGPRAALRVLRYRRRRPGLRRNPDERARILPCQMWATSQSHVFM